MRFAQCLPLATVATAIVIPDEQAFAGLIPDNYKENFPEYDQWLSGVKDSVDNVKEASKDFIDEALSSVSEQGAAAYEKIYNTAYDVESWLKDSVTTEYPFDDINDEEEHPPHHGPPHRGPHHPPHHGPSQLTVYQLIAKSKYTTKLAKLISEDDELVKILNGTAANYTVFAPTDRAFAKIPKHAPKPTKKQIRDVLSYHVSPELYSARRVLGSHTIPTLFKSPDLGEEPLPQRLAVGIGLKGLAVNFYSRVIATNIVSITDPISSDPTNIILQFGSNGVIHGVDSIIIPPPSTLAIIGFFPGEFSTLSLGLEKTNLLKTLNKTAHAGSTFFAPSNFAFQKLGPKINAFLFSKYGQKYLKALLQYHVVHNQTLYSDAFYKSSSEEVLPKGLFHVDLPTLLEDRSLSVDIARYGPFIEIKINGFARVAVKDGVARDGVIQIVGDVLIPPKKLGGEQSYWKGEEMSVDEFKERLEPFVADEQFEL